MHLKLGDDRIQQEPCSGSWETSTGRTIHHDVSMLTLSFVIYDECFFFVLFFSVWLNNLGVKVRCPFPFSYFQAVQKAPSQAGCAYVGLGSLPEGYYYINGRSRDESMSETYMSYLLLATFFRAGFGTICIGDGIMYCTHVQRSDWSYYCCPRYSLFASRGTRGLLLSGGGGGRWERVAI